MPPAAEGIESPYDVEARYRHKRDTQWTGYMVHVSERVSLRSRICSRRCIRHRPRYMRRSAPPIQQALIDKDLAPGEHLVDAAYISSELLVHSRDDQGILLRGPTRPSQGWQTQVRALIRSNSLRWTGTSSKCAAPRATCQWRGGSMGGQGGRPIIVEFDKHTCGTCPVRPCCTRAKHTGRRLRLPPQDQYEALQAAQTWSASRESQQLYKRRAGVEGTLSQGVRAFGLRRTRYWGLAKTHLQHVATAAAINIDRIVAWLDECPRAKTRTSRFAALAPACAIPSRTPPGKDNG